jgi:hypothetical protein
MNETIAIAVLIRLRCRARQDALIPALGRGRRAVAALEAQAFALRRSDRPGYLVGDP